METAGVCVFVNLCTFAGVCVFSPAVNPCVVKPLAADKLKRAKQPINSFILPHSSPSRSHLSPQCHSCQLIPSNVSYLSWPETCPPTTSLHLTRPRARSFLCSRWFSLNVLKHRAAGCKNGKALREKNWYPILTISWWLKKTSLFINAAFCIIYKCTHIEPSKISETLCRTGSIWWDNDVLSAVVQRLAILQTKVMCWCVYGADIHSSLRKCKKKVSF